MDLRGARRRLDLRLPGAGAAVGDVRPDGVVEQHGVLRHQTDRGAQGLLSDVAQILAVDQDRALVDVVEAEQQAHDRGLAGARPAHQRERVAGGDGEVELAQHRPPGIIAEAHRLEAHRRRQPARAGARPAGP